MDTADNGNVTKVKVERLQRDLDKAMADIDKLDAKLADMTVMVGRLQERMTIFNMGQSVFTALAATVAAIFGRSA